MKRVIFLGVLSITIASLYACDIQPKKPQAVKVPVSVSCLKEVPAVPAYEFPYLPKPVTDEDDANQVRALWRDWNKADMYGKAWEAAAEGCLLLKPP